MPDVVSPATPITLQSLFAPGLAAVRKFWRPFLLLQSAAFLVVLGYYTNDQVRSFCEQLSRYKEREGLIFSAISAAIAGALLPELAKTIMLGDRTVDAKRLRDVGFALVVFGGCGVMIDLQYRGLGWLLGRDQHPSTIIAKVLIDQFLLTALYGNPYWVVAYSLRAKRYNLIATLGEISPRWYLMCVLPLLIPGWCYWLPMVTLVYSLPGSLQFCLFCFALAAWSLVLVFVATHEAAARVSMPAA